MLSRKSLKLIFFLILLRYISLFSIYLVELKDVRRSQTEVAGELISKGGGIKSA